MERLMPAMLLASSLAVFLILLMVGSYDDDAEGSS
jgi:hypothetical protein